MRTAVSLALLLGVLGAGTAGAAFLLQRRTSPAAAPSTGAPSTATPSPAMPTSPAAPSPVAPSLSTLPPTSSVPTSPPVTTMPAPIAPAVVLAPSVISPVTDVWQRAGSTHALQYASDSILARLKDPQQQWPGGTPPWIFDERNPFPVFDR
ncbi:hypothetical protein [Deinococcus soli (ex Cha et al. 2016)]|uniref:hypothetical protein n=1 Tax=Deinococcus soli (ex Cha et al. 2016) TaxID=1309411 RepID=UPI0016666242|nr:hypothetical protein [Deinococcus soli (ex Cha et al. 2016)]